MAVRLCKSALNAVEDGHAGLQARTSFYSIIPYWNTCSQDVGSNLFFPTGICGERYFAVLPYWRGKWRKDCLLRGAKARLLQIPKTSVILWSITKARIGLSIAKTLGEVLVCRNYCSSFMLQWLEMITGWEKITPFRISLIPLFIVLSSHKSSVRMLSVSLLIKNFSSINGIKTNAPFQCITIVGNIMY